jgi:formylglycine-generating enzyme
MTCTLRQHDGRGKGRRLTIAHRWWIAATLLMNAHPSSAAPTGSAPAPVPAAGRPTTLVVVPPARVIVPGGRFTMGAAPADIEQARALCTEELRSGGALRLELGARCQGRFESESPAASVFLPAFAIDRTEVTVAAFGDCVRARGCRPLPGVSAWPAPVEGARPVERASHADADDFCRWRGGRLPTEAEWEKAARGPLPRPWPWGTAWSERRANHGRAERLAPSSGPDATEETVDPADGFAGVAPPGSFPAGASPYGVLDMAGNVWEWTGGYFAREPPQASTRFDPRGPPGGSERTIRGGGYRSPPSDLRVTRRVGLHPAERLAGVGFRCAYDVPAPAETRR